MFLSILDIYAFLQTVAAIGQHASYGIHLIVVVHVPVHVYIPDSSSCIVVLPAIVEDERHRLASVGRALALQDYEVVGLVRVECAADILDGVFP